MNTYSFKLLDFNKSNQAFIFKILDKVDTSGYRFVYIPYSMFASTLMLDFMLAKREHSINSTALEYLCDVVSRDFEKYADKHFIIISDRDRYIEGNKLDYALGRRDIVLSDVLSHLSGKCVIDRYGSEIKSLHGGGEHRVGDVSRELVYQIEDERYFKSIKLFEGLRDSDVQGNTHHLHESDFYNDRTVEISCIDLFDMIKYLYVPVGLVGCIRLDELESLTGEGITASYTNIRFGSMGNIVEGGYFSLIDIILPVVGLNLRELYGELHNGKVYYKNPLSGFMDFIHAAERPDVMQGVIGSLSSAERFDLDYIEMADLFTLDSDFIRKANLLFLSNYDRESSVPVVVNYDRYADKLKESILSSNILSDNSDNGDIRTLIGSSFDERYSSLEILLGASHINFRYGVVNGGIVSDKYSHGEGIILGIDNASKYSETESIYSIEGDNCKDVEEIHNLEISIFKEVENIYSVEFFKHVGGEGLVFDYEAVGCKGIESVVSDIAYSSRHKEVKGFRLTTVEGIRVDIRLSNLLEYTSMATSEVEGLFSTVDYSCSKLDREFAIEDLVSSRLVVDRYARVLHDVFSTKDKFSGDTYIHRTDLYDLFKNVNMVADIFSKRFLEGAGVELQGLRGRFDNDRIAYLDYINGADYELPCNLSDNLFAGRQSIKYGYLGYSYDVDYDLSCDLSYDLFADRQSIKHGYFECTLNISKEIPVFMNESIVTDFSKDSSLEMEIIGDKILGSNGYDDGYILGKRIKDRNSSRVEYMLEGESIQSGYLSILEETGGPIERIAFMNFDSNLLGGFIDCVDGVIENTLYSEYLELHGLLNDAMVAERVKRKKLSKNNIIDYERLKKKQLKPRGAVKAIRYKLKNIGLIDKDSYYREQLDKLSIDSQETSIRDIYSKLDADLDGITTLNERDKLPLLVDKSKSSLRKQQSNKLDILRDIISFREQLEKLYKVKMKRFDYEKEVVISEMELFEKEREGLTEEARLGKGLLYDYSNVLKDEMQVDKWMVGYAIPEKYNPKDPFNPYYPWAEEHTAHSIVQGNKWSGSGDWKVDRENIYMTINGDGIVLTENKFSDFKYSFFTSISENPEHRSGIVFNHENAENYYKFTISSSAIVPFELVRVFRGEDYKIAIPMHPIKLNPFVKHEVDISLVDNRLVIYVNDHIQYDLILEY